MGHVRQVDFTSALLNECADEAGAEMMACTLADHIATGLIFVDGQGVISFFNAGAERMLNVRRGDVLGKRVDMLPLRTPPYKVLSENCRDFPVELSINGAVLRVKASPVVIPGAMGEGELIEMRDVTEEKRERRQREEFVAMMTHDLKSPLTVIMGYIQALKGGMLGSVDATARLCVDELDRNSERLLGMIEDVLDAYRLEVGLLSIHREATCLKDVLLGCCHDVEREMQHKGIAFTASVAGNLPSLWLDRKQIMRVFANLLGNAVKFTPVGGKISVTAEQRADQVDIMIADTGIGIPEADLCRVFNKYFRAGTAAGYKGTGLGLAITKAIVEAHGGAVRVSSRVGTGSTFTVTLPAM